MYHARIEPPWDSGAWRAMARMALCAGVAPEEIAWNGDAQGGLLVGIDVETLAPIVSAPKVSAEFLSLASAVLCHRDPQRHALLYRLLWRIAHGERHLLARATDIDVHRANVLAKTVGRDSHKMKAFVRFRAVPGQDNAYVAWFEPDHHIVDRVAPFFARRFAGMRWAILTPERSATWDGVTLQTGPGGSRSDAPADDAQETLWRTYYANIFNPARLNPTMMRQEMPQKYWKHLPEAELLPDLIRDAGQRVRDMIERAAQSPRRKIPKAIEKPAKPGTGGVDELRVGTLACRRCPLWQPATQAVFGQGPATARVMLIGEQPGDEEDLSGRPFIGPAGKLLDRALMELGLDRNAFYLTNVVKHFHFEQRGKRRLHKSPEARHIEACQTWLLGELDAVRPEFIICLGATAAHAVLGSDFQLMRQRGRWIALANAARAMATVHPAWVLRQPVQSREQAFSEFTRDLGLLKVSLDEATQAGFR